jgi:hypothetical protein
MAETPCGSGRCAPSARPRRGHAQRPITCHLENRRIRAFLDNRRRSATYRLSLAHSLALPHSPPYGDEYDRWWKV